MANQAPMRQRHEGKRPEPCRVHLTNREVEKLQPGEREYAIYDQATQGS